ncbi:hypothetical protein LINPERPRIM_LOCUS38596 [Linum perenne]
MLKNRTFYVEYESLENICVNCGFYGHKLDECSPSKPQLEKEPASAEEVVIPEPAKVDAAIGDWMIVARKQRGRPNKDV